MKRILVVSDMHVGSTVAVMPDEVNPDKGGRIEANPLQRVLYEKWQEMVDRGRFDACFVLGDAVDGPNIKSRGFELWTSNLRQQVTTAADLLGMVRTRRYYGVQGSFYHVSENTSADLAVIDCLRGTFGSDLVIVSEECRMHICHEIGYSGSPVSKATAPSTELAFSAIHDPHMGTFDLLLRGHRHDYYDLRTVLGHIVGCPGWKVRDAFAAKKGLKMLSNLGYLVLEIRGADVTVDPTVWVPARGHQFTEVSL